MRIMSELNTMGRYMNFNYSDLKERLAIIPMLYQDTAMLPIFINGKIYGYKSVDDDVVVTDEKLIYCRLLDYNSLYKTRDVATYDIMKKEGFKIEYSSTTNY